LEREKISKWKGNWIGHILCRNCLLQWVTEGTIKGGIEVTGRRGRRCRKLLDDLKERRGYSHLKEEALDCTMWRARFGRGFGPVVRQATKLMNNIVKVGFYVSEGAIPNECEIKKMLIYTEIVTIHVGLTDYLFVFCLK